MNEKRFIQTSDASLPKGKAGDLVRVTGRIVTFQTEPLDDGEAKPLTRVLIEFTEIELLKVIE